MATDRKLPSKEEWIELSNELSHAYGHAFLRVDQFALRLEVRLTGALKYEIMPFVDGIHRGAWLINDCEERRRFLRPVKIPLYTPRQRAKILKTFGKRGTAKLFPEINRTRMAYYPTWSSFNALRRHLMANNRDIEILDDKEEDAA